MSTKPGVSRVRRGGGTRAPASSPISGKSTTNSSESNNNDGDDDAKASASSSMTRLYQGALQLRKSFRSSSKAKNEQHLPLHHHNNKDNVHIQVPVRMMLSTFSIFLILPLTLFAWRQFHPIVVRVVEDNHKSAQNSGIQHHDKFPTWMDEISMPPLKPVQESSTSSNQTAVTQERNEEPRNHDSTTENTLEKIPLESDPSKDISRSSEENQPALDLHSLPTKVKDEQDETVEDEHDEIEEEADEEKAPQ